MVFALKLAAVCCWCFAVYFIIKASQHLDPAKQKAMILPVWMFRKSVFSDEGNRYRKKALVTFVVGMILLIFYISVYPN